VGGEAVEGVRVLVRSVASRAGVAPEKQG
jgi:hypothetical protein